MKEYERLQGVDVVARVERFIDQGVFEVDDESHLIPTGKAYFADHAWVHSRIDDERRCAKWMDIYWKKYNLISSGCFACWKVVATPETLKQLFTIHDLQVKMDLPSKCGMERRTNTQGLYHAFWYSPLSDGLDGGRILYKKIKTKLKQHGINIPIILKRA